jgi:hypothetical protein
MKNYTNIKTLFFTLTALLSLNMKAQEKQSIPETNFEMGQGLQFNFNKGDYQFKIGGMIQPQFSYRKDSTAENKYYLNSKRSYFNISGKAAKEKISFLLQTDFSLSNPLLDAWVAYQPYSYLKFTFGQQLSFANNREMGFMENQLQFLDRSLLSTKFSSSGREFGLFVESNFSLGTMVFSPKAAITSGDGRNSFGASGTDYDLGGVKYSGRLDFLPLGRFTEGNELLVADYKYENKPKVVLGMAGSINKGATHQTGEGHGNFFLYDNKGKNKLPDYRKIYYDVLLKYKGFSVLAEYIIATAKVTDGSFYDVSGLNPIVPTEISQLLSIGTGFNTQLSYVWNKKYGIDFRYAKLSPEFTNNFNSIIRNNEEISYGISKYINENNLKISATISHLKFESQRSLLCSIYIQLTL